jgi:myo-inositol-1(or 4)-monophosphatase
MNTLDREKEFFQAITPKVRELVLSFNGKAAISVQKTSMDYATEVDIAVENMIVEEIQRRFPGDAIMAEEGHADAEIPDGRIWIIDPICGTTNIGRGLTSFCTNIALADNNQLIASCVVDHSQNDYFWSVGDNKVYVNQTLVKFSEPAEGIGIVVDVDMGSIKSLKESGIEQFNTFLNTLLKRTEYMPMSLNSSLGFAYSAIGKLDGFVNVFNHPWDICASSFLLQQAGGVITGTEGQPWTLTTIGAIGARDSAVHKQLLDAYNGR